VSTLVELDAFLSKTEAYVTTPDAVFTDRNLYLAEILFPYDWDGGPYSLDGAADIVEPALAYVPATIHNALLYQNYAAFPASHPLNSTAAIDSIERGYNLVVHVGHGNKDIMRVSKDNYITMSDMSALANGMDRSSFMWLLNCTSTAIDYDCIAERAINDPDGGAFALFGPTRFAFPATMRSYLWDWLDVLYNQGVTELGPVCAEAKALHASFAESGADNTDRWTQFALVLLGDPEAELWVDRPASLSVAHAGSISVGDTTMVVTVTDPSPVDSALVCAYKAGEIYAVASTDAAGQATLEVVPHTTGSMTITVTATGYLPYTADVNVTAAAAAHVHLCSWSVDDDTSGGSEGNGNGQAEAGETVELDIVVENSGASPASGVTATLSSNDPYVVVQDSTEVIGDVGAGATAAVDAAFRVHVTTDCPNEHDVPFTIEFVEGGRLAWIEELQCRVYRPELRQLYLAVDDSGGNGNGIPEAGETVSLFVEILNQGNGDADDVTGVLRYPGSSVSLTDSTDTWGDVASGLSAEGTGFQFTVNSDVTERFRLVLSDAWGNTWTSYLDVDSPDAPADLWARVKGTTIQLHWSVVDDDDLFGYDVYRAEDVCGPYQRANDAMVEGTAYYADAGLAEKTLYHYFVAAVDSSGNVSAPSSTLSISTNPPSMPGWPMSTGAGMYSSPAAADIDGDGELEIIVTSEQLYAWNADGTEVCDGDGDPRTSGIFAVDGLGGYRCSAAVGEVDGDPGLEIVAAAWANVGTEEDPAYNVFVWNADDGTVLPGWPVTTGKFCWASPALADFDHDGRSEILIPSADGYLYCWRYDGSEYIDGDGDPLTIGVFASLGAQWNYGSPAVADLDGDRIPEIIQASRSDSLYVFRSDGSIFPGWPVYLEGDSECSVAVGDVDNDGAPEIAVHSNICRVWLLESDGSVMSGWPKPVEFSGDFPPAPVLADLTGDGYLEIVLSGSDGSITVKDYLGADLPGWPQYRDGTGRSSAAVADIDGDPELEIVVGCNDGKLYCYDPDGTIIAGWPIQTDAEIYGSPLVVDLDGDGDTEVIVGGMDTNVYVWDCDGTYADGEGVEWGCFLHDSWRTQFYGFDDPVGIETDEEFGGFAKLILAQNVPNPFNPTTSVPFVVPLDAGGARPVSLGIYSVDGRLVRVLVDGELEAGRYAAVWDGRDDAGAVVASGVYFCRLEVGGESAVRKMVLLK